MKCPELIQKVVRFLAIAILTYSASNSWAATKARQIHPSATHQNPTHSPLEVSLGCFPFRSTISVQVEELSKDLIKLAFDSHLVDPDCSTNYLLRLLSQPDSELPAQTRDSLWKAITNHETSRMKTFPKSPKLADTSAADQLIIDNFICAKECQNSTLQGVYESFLAKSVIQFESQLNVLNSASLFRKIFDQQKELFKKYQENINLLWQSNSYKLYPVAQRRPKTPEDIQKFLEHPSDIPLALDYFMTTYGLPRNNTIPLFSALFKDQPEAMHLTKTQDSCYANQISTIRGTRYQSYQKAIQNLPASNQSGIVSQLDIPSLRLHITDQPWVHAGKSKGILPNSSQFVRNSAIAGIPVVCGVSGSTNIALWSLLSLKLDLSPAELRLFLLATWATLCADGGHSLQEVLSAGRIVSDYIATHGSDVIDPQHSTLLKDVLSKKTVAALNDVTSKFSNGNSQLIDSWFGKYQDGFFYDLEKDYPAFAAIQARAKKETLEWYQSSSCNGPQSIQSAPVH